MTPTMIQPEVKAPDFVEVAVGWRSWRIEDGLLRSPLHNTPWHPGQEAKAICAPSSSPSIPYYRWEAMRDVVTPDEDQVQKMRNDYARFSTMNMPVPTIPPVPVIVLPHGWGWCLRDANPQHNFHAAPEEGCGCGIYAAKIARALDYHYSSDSCIGTVSLWGKVIPGEHGWRAAKAYPRELFIVKPTTRRSWWRKDAATGTHPLERAYKVPVHRVGNVAELWSWEDA